MLNVNAVARTDIGLVRARNEDSFLIEPGASLYAVADGMGGHAAGDVASQTAIASFHAAFDETRDLRTAAKTANRAIFERAEAEPEKSGMGTTLTAVHINSRTLRAAHVGDSRLYLLRNAQLEQITRDHTLAQELVDDGRLHPAMAAHHPSGHVLTRALGTSRHIQVDLLEETLQPNDVLLLCTDGLSGMLEDEVIREILLSDSELPRRADELIKQAKRRGGLDNITVILLELSAQPASNG